MTQQYALITGGAGELGSAIAEGLIRSGVNAFVTSRDYEKAQRVANHLCSKASAEAYPLQLDDNTDLATLAKMIGKVTPYLNIIVHAAGGNNPAEFIEPGQDPLSANPEAVIQTMLSNISPIIKINHALRELWYAAPWGSMINIGSMAGLKPLPGIMGYSAGKSAVHSLTSYLGMMLGMYKPTHRANAIAFGFTETPQNREKLRHPDGSLKPRAHAIASMHPNGELGETKDIVPVALFLASQSSSAINGQVFAADRGFTSMSLPRY